MKLSEDKKKAGWQIVRFDEVAKEVKATTSDPIADGLEYYVGLEHLDPQSLCIQRKGVIAEDNPTFTRLFKPGQILFGKRRAYQKKAAVADFSGICSGDILVMEAKPGKILPGLLPFIVQSDLFFDHAVKTSSGSLSPRTKWKSLAEFEFPLPPPARQKTILEVLEKVEETGCAYDASINIAELTLQVLINRLIRNPDDKSAYESGRIGDFLQLQRGFDLTKAQVNDGKVPVISSSGLSYYHNESMLTGESVITGRKGKLGEAYYIEGPCWPHDTTLFVKDFKGHHPRFIYWLLQSLRLEQYDAATAVPTLNRNVVHKVKTLFPKSHMQHSIVDILDEHANEIKVLETQRSRFDFTRKLLVNKLFFEDGYV